jgi:FolB domain-containing protein
LDKVFVTDLLARVRIGISEKERERPQDVLINVELETDLSQAGASDDLDDCIDYSRLTKDILALAEANQRKTLEAFAADILRICLSHPLASATRVRVEKTSAVRFTKATGVEIYRVKE